MGKPAIRKFSCGARLRRSTSGHRLPIAAASKRQQPERARRSPGAWSASSGALIVKSRQSEDVYDDPSSWSIADVLPRSRSQDGADAGSAAATVPSAR